MEKTQRRQGPPLAKRAVCAGRRFAHLRLPKGQSLREKALRWLGGFLLLMLLFTLLSRTADELTIPRVSLEEAQSRPIEHKVTAFGKVEELSATAVLSVPGIRVAGIAVKAGGKVEQGEPLFTLDREDLAQKAEDAKKELESMELDLEALRGREALEAQDRETALARARQDYAAAETSTGKEVERAAEALEKARAKLREAQERPMPDLTVFQAALKEAETAWNSAEEAWKQLEEEIEEQAEQARKAAEEAGEDPAAAEAELRERYAPELEAAGERRETGQREKQEAQEALARAQQEKDELLALQEAVESAQQAYDQAREAQDTSLKAASRAVEDAQRPSVPDTSGEKAEKEREAQKEKIRQLQELLEEGGVVRAPQGGMVTEVFLEVGSPVPEGTALLLADGSKGAVFTAQVPASQEKYLAPGGEVALKPNGGKEALTGLTLESVRRDNGDQSLLNVAVRLPEGTMEIGTSAEMEVSKNSKEYPVCVPLSVLHEENGAYYLLVPRETDTVLGKDLVADRLDVMVLEKNESYAALAEGSLLRGQKFLTYSNKAVRAGDRIRLENP